MIGLLELFEVILVLFVGLIDVGYVLVHVLFELIMFDFIID